MPGRPSRRELLAGAAVAVTGAGVGGAVVWTGRDPRPAAEPGYLPPPGGRFRVSTDVCVHGGTPAGVAAAVTARRWGASVALVVAGDHVGGMMSGGLSATDHGFGGDLVLGGFARRFFRGVAAHYGGGDGFAFEPHVAEQVLVAAAAAAGIRVYYRQAVHGVERGRDGALAALVTAAGSRFAAHTFVDAGYEGDLMALTEVPHVVGRESRTTYGESLAGVGLATTPQSFRTRLGPYVRPGEPASGLLAGRWNTTPGPLGDGDSRVQAYGFRLCLRIEPDGPALPVPKPARYDGRRYGLLARYIRDGTWDALSGHAPIPGGKADLNSNGGFSTDDVGASDGWAAGDAAARQRIFAEHVTYQQGLLWFLAHDTRVPDRIRHRVAQFGLAPDEFVATGGWPHQLYVREARRMRSDTVVTQSHVQGRQAVPDPIAVGYYPVDVHPCSRTVVDGAARNEGTLFAHVPGPYPVPYGALVPPRDGCPNLLVPVCLSASHVGYGSLRVEPTFLGLGQAAGAAAALAVTGRTSVQDVPYASLRSALLAGGQRLRV